MSAAPMSLEERLAIADRLTRAIYGRPAMTIVQASRESGVSARTISGIIHGATPSSITAHRLLNLWSKT